MLNIRACCWVIAFGLFGAQVASSGTIYGALNTQIWSGNFSNTICQDQQSGFSAGLYAAAQCSSSVPNGDGTFSVFDGTAEARAIPGDAGAYSHIVAGPLGAGAFAGSITTAASAASTDYWSFPTASLASPVTLYVQFSLRGFITSSGDSTIWPFLIFAEGSVAGQSCTTSPQSPTCDLTFLITTPSSFAVSEYIQMDATYGANATSGTFSGTLDYLHSMGIDAVDLTDQTGAHISPANLNTSSGLPLGPDGYVPEPGTLTLTLLSLSVLVFVVGTRWRSRIDTQLASSGDGADQRDRQPSIRPRRVVRRIRFQSVR